MKTCRFKADYSYTILDPTKGEKLLFQGMATIALGLIAIDGRVKQLISARLIKLNFPPNRLSVLSFFRFLFDLDPDSDPDPDLGCILTSLARHSPELAEAATAADS